MRERERGKARSPASCRSSVARKFGREMKVTLESDTFGSTMSRHV